jgi:hypothetical protein
MEDVYEFIQKYATYPINNREIVKNQLTHPASIVIKDTHGDIAALVLWGWNGNEEVEITDYIIRPDYRHTDMWKRMAVLGNKKWPEVKTLTYIRYKNNRKIGVRKLNLRRLASGHTIKELSEQPLV